MAEKKQNKSSKVLTLLAGPHKTDREIAKEVGCTVSLVNKVRNSSGE